MRNWLLLPLLCLLSGLAHAGNLVGVTADEALALQGKGALVVDVRTPEEWKKTGVIPGSKGLTFFNATGSYDKDDWLKQLKTLVKSPEQPIVLVCASGRRSGLVGKMLTTEAGYQAVYNLDKGVRGWSAENKPLVVE